MIRTLGLGLPRLGPNLEYKTGPITLAAWSYLPEGVGFREAVMALAEVLREEVREVAAQGIRMVQVDEPALLEKLPLKAKEHPGYLALVREAFLRVGGICLLGYRCTSTSATLTTPPQGPS